MTQLSRHPYRMALLLVAALIAGSLLAVHPMGEADASEQGGVTSETLSSFKFKAKKRVFKGTIEPDPAAPLCVADRNVVLKMKKRGADRKSGKAVSNAAGKWSIKVGKKAKGHFYVVIKPKAVGEYGSLADCSMFRSEAIKIKPKKKH